MTLNDHQEAILAALRSVCRTALRDENGAWRDIATASDRLSDPGGPDRKARLDRYIYDLGLIYAHQTGAMPGFTNSESETRFERFVAAIPMAAEWKVTRNLIKACIRRIDAKRNPEFARDLENKGRENAAE
jgi:hypothetical protein